MTNDLFTLFDMVDEDNAVKREKQMEEEKAKAEAKQKAEAELKEKTAKLKEEGKEKKDTKPTTNVVAFTPNEQTVIRYYGESYPITTYFSVEELEEGLLVVKKGEEPVRKPLTTEMLRARMEKDYPELVKNHTEIIFLADKNLVIPMIAAKKKGYCSKEEAKPSGQAFSFPLPKIPFEILQQFISLARVFQQQELEVHADIYYNPTSHTYILDIPEQRVHKYWVEVTESPYSIISRVFDAIKVMEFHSHHKLLTFPSSQDDESERCPGMLYGIVGNITENFPNELPHLYMRQFISEKDGHREVPFFEVFEDPFQDLPAFDITKIEVVK